ncbi:hypothetical protein TNCV_992931 [Trichonephila clavipes]|nr:hypothetical protein TNCV_992931 [Trichonephila clavipes]
MRVPAEESSSSLDHGSELLGPSPKEWGFPRDRFVALNPLRVSSVPMGIPPTDLELPWRGTLINSHSSQEDDNRDGTSLFKFPLQANPKTLRLDYGVTFREIFHGDRQQPNENIGAPCKVRLDNVSREFVTVATWLSWSHGLQCHQDSYPRLEKAGHEFETMMASVALWSRQRTLGRCVMRVRA